MSENTAAELEHDFDIKTIPIFGYELIREILIPEILGNGTPEILYWAGKRLARKFPLSNFDEITDFFKKAAWGNLTLVSESKNELQLELSSSLITERIQNKGIHHFQLEAGFLAEQIETQKQMICEVFEHPRKKGGKVQFTVKWDKKDAVVY